MIADYTHHYSLRVLSAEEAARGICEWEWLTDDVLRLDVAEHCANDVSYFPFDELVEALVLALSRDCEVGQLCESGLPQVPLVADAAGALAVQTSELREVRAGGQAMPPSGVVPFKGFSNYACPFAFLADRLETAYPIFRSFYCRHLCRLHTISDHPETLLSLCALFEQLVVSTAPRAAQHLQFVLDSSPLRYAFHWIVTGFVGSLPAEEVLQLWDRVLGFDSVALVPILAAAIVALRSKLILAARRPEEVQLVFSDISCVKAIPLLQSFLFAHELGADANWRTEHGSVLSAALAAKKAALVAPILEAKASIGEHDVGALSRLFRGEGPASTDTVEILLQPQGDCNA
ncbi:TBC1 domain family member 19 [Durusdinium trenchii]|uniref:TBC1 domain family member 19 n=1 Tax=Durusdinium trenchii TaxID=1381693 RepID=A0ABP0I2K7_9DINO